MKHSQDKTQCQAALLCNKSGGDTPVKNSLCCVAAGIIAPLSATAEALIPHEKLRRAALADATLTAQERSLAQPVLVEKTLLVLGQLHRSQLLSRDRNSLGVSREHVSTSQPILYVVFREQSRKNNALFESPPYHQKWFDHFREGQVYGINPLQGHQLLLHGGYYFRFESYISGLDVVETPEQMTTHARCTVRNTTYKLKNNLMPCTSSRSCIASLLITNIESSDDSGDTSESLKPCSRILLRVKRIKHDKKRPPQSTNGQKDPNNPYARNFQIRQSIKPHIRPWPPAIGILPSLPSFATAVHRGAV